ncbi:PREDICTED: dynein intermediate chain 3, ciliary-like, partial [Amphimedon queenslandica]
MEIVYVYTKKRNEFGRQAIFSDRPPELSIDIRPDSSMRNDYIRKDPVDIAVQYTSDMSEHEVNTERFETEIRGVNHTEGGWPKDINPAEVEQTIRFRKKVEKDEIYMQVIQDLGTKMEHYLKQNNSVDIYEEYFDKTEPLLNDKAPNARTINILRDPSDIKRTVSNISWYPDGANKIAVAYSALEFQKTSDVLSFDSYIWDIENPNKPEMTLKPASPMLCLEYNPKDSHTLAAGCYNGQIAIFDTRKSSQPTDTTPVEISHRDPVHKLIYPSSKTGNDIFSTSTDGQVMWWDIRKLVEPVETLVLEYPGYKPDVTLGGITLEYESTMPTKFMVGTEQGVILSGNRKGKTPQDKLAHAFVGHLGPIYSLQRNPFYPKQFLTVGDWTTKIWSEDAKESPIMWTQYNTTPLTDGCWSPTRPGVFFTTSMSGSLNVWDLCLRQTAPSLAIQVCDESLHSIRVHEQGRLVACGSHSGVVTLLELSGALSVLQPNEKHNINAIFERETKREKILEGRRREMKLKAKQAAASGGGGGG